MVLRLNTYENCNGIRWVLLPYIECAPISDEVYKELGCICLTFSTTDKENHSTVIGRESSIKTELNLNECLELEPFRANGNIVQVVIGNYRISPQSRALSWRSHCYYISGLYGYYLLKQEGL